ncbi:MAG: hypothetical protein EU530_05345 [Promethearchaeota archaeon]|nr:MAG: hypothetical protein EU530_05345 [Candidatus Lokiarchaeota archaeon]
MTDIDDILMQPRILRELLIGFESIIGAFYIFYCMKFIVDAIRRKKKGEPIGFPLAWAFFFFGQFLFDALKMFADFYQDLIPEIIDRAYLNNVASALGLLGLVLISIQIETILKSGFINTIIIGLISLCAIFFYNFPSNYLTLFIFVAFFSTLGIIYAAIKTRVEHHPYLNDILIVFVVGFILSFTGNLLKTDFILNLFSEPFGLIFGDSNDILFIRLLAGDAIVIGSIFVIQFSFYEFPSIMELTWTNYLFELHIVSYNGIELYNKRFYEERGLKTGTHPDLMAAAFSGIQDIIKEITGSEENVDLIDQGNYKMIFEKSEYSIVILIVSEYLDIYRYKLQKLCPEIEEKYGKHIKKWTGDMSIFEDANELIEHYFNIEELIPKKKPKNNKKPLFSLLHRSK